MLIFGMQLKYSLSCLNVRLAHNYLAVKTSRSHNRRVKYIHSVGGSHNDNALIRCKAVHLYKHLVKSLLSLIMRTAKSCTSASCHSIYLVYENDAGAVSLGFVEHISDTCGTDAHIHFHEIRTGYAEERHLGFSCYCLGKQGLTRTGRTYKYYALWYTCSHIREGLRIA